MQQHLVSVDSVRERVGQLQTCKCYSPEVPRRSCHSATKFRTHYPSFEPPILTFGSTTNAH